MGRPLTKYPPGMTNSQKVMARNREIEAQGYRRVSVWVKKEIPTDKVMATIKRLNARHK